MFDATGETVHLYLLSGRERVCIEEVLGPGADASLRVLGHAHALHVGAAGQVMLASLPEHDIKQVIAELRKVIWPNRKQMVTYTTVVLVFLAFMVALIGGVDLGLAKLVTLVFG